MCSHQLEEEDLLHAEVVLQDEEEEGMDCWKMQINKKEQISK